MIIFLVRSQSVHFLILTGPKPLNAIFHRGVWNSVFISSVFLIKKEVLKKMHGSFGPSQLDPDMAMSKFLRDNVSKTVTSRQLDTHDVTKL